MRLNSLLSSPHVFLFFKSQTTEWKYVRRIWIASVCSKLLRPQDPHHPTRMTDVESGERGRGRLAPVDQCPHEPWTRLTKTASDLRDRNDKPPWHHLQRDVSVREALCLNSHTTSWIFNKYTTYCILNEHILQTGYSMSIYDRLPTTYSTNIHYVLPTAYWVISTTCCLVSEWSYYQ